MGPFAEICVILELVASDPLEPQSFVYYIVDRSVWYLIGVLGTHRSSYNGLGLFFVLKTLAKNTVDFSQNRDIVALTRYSRNILLIYKKV
jgi:hypothetical protein